MKRYKNMKMTNLKILKQRQKSIVLPFLGVALFWACSFLPAISPSSFGGPIKLLYLFSVLCVLVLIGIYGLISAIRFCIAKARKRPQSTLTVVGVSLLLSFVVVAPTALAVHRYLPRPLPTGSDLKPFNPTAWKDAASTEWAEGISVREKMLKDVVENILPGKTREEVEALLGPSLKTMYFASVNKDLIYYLGPERDGLFNIDSEWLLIWFRKDGKFARYRIAND